MSGEASRCGRPSRSLSTFYVRTGWTGFHPRSRGGAGAEHTNGSGGKLCGSTSCGMAVQVATQWKSSAPFDVAGQNPAALHGANASQSRSRPALRLLKARIKHMTSILRRFTIRGPPRRGDRARHGVPPYTYYYYLTTTAWGAE